MPYENILRRLRELGSPEMLGGMARFGINTVGAYGVSVTELRRMAKKIGQNRELALWLWASGVHEARILASMVDDPERVTERQMDSWVKDFDSWDVCDQVCGNLFDKTEFAYKKAFEWSRKSDEFVKRAGFVMMACLAVHDKTAKDKDLEKFLPIIVREATDDRNFVKKAVNWALRQIGKRNARLNVSAVKTAIEIQKIDSPSARWIASDALREFERKRSSAGR
jgi:3-methyladenine DNA glycosylase AlkD